MEVANGTPLTSNCIAQLFYFGENFAAASPLYSGDNRIHMTIGIVTISYNQARYLTECIESVKVSDSSHLKYVVVDAGSTDGSQQLILQHQDRFSTIIFEPDKGPADGLNKGFARCRADVYGYLNSDDRFRPGALDYVLEYFAQHPETDILLGSIAMIDGNGHLRLRKRTQDRPFDVRKFAVCACNVFQQGTFFRREAFARTGGFNLGSKTAWDSELVVDMALAGCTFGYTNKVLADFRVHPESITGSRRLWEGLMEDREHLRQKIWTAGFAPYSPLEERMVKLAHKFNPARHLSYLLAS
ncbi:MAG TPA: glycosyltransferase family 2 protein [Bryobacteraceae bacterium]|jgi:glycosyltransferase involved in cell wall biosynthesis